MLEFIMPILGDADFRRFMLISPGAQGALLW